MPSLFSTGIYMPYILMARGGFDISPGKSRVDGYTVIEYLLKIIIIYCLYSGN
jgi:hypothetical protein